MNEFDQAREEMRMFISDRADLARAVVAFANQSYSIKNSSKMWCDGWLVGYKRCLAEMKRIAEKAA